MWRTEHQVRFKPLARDHDDKMIQAAGGWTGQVAGSENEKILYKGAW